MSKYKLGYRAWLLNPTFSQTRLISMNVVFLNQLYQPRKMMRATHGGTYGIMNLGGLLSTPCEGMLACECGIHAFKTLDDLKLYFQHEHIQTYLFENNIEEHYKIIVGQVALWGQVVTHNLGYRAEFAYPQGFYPTHNFIPQLASTWGVDVLSEVKWATQKV